VQPNQGRSPYGRSGLIELSFLVRLPERFERAILRSDGAFVVLAMFAVVMWTRWPRWLLTGTSGTNADVWRWIIVAAPVVAGLSIKAAEVPRPWRFLIRAVGTVLAVYGVSTIQPFALDLHASALAGQAYLALPLIGLLCAIFGWWRPSLYVLPVVAVSWYREEFSRCIGFPTANGEELTLQECALFLLVGGIALAIWKRLRPSQSAGIASVFSTLVMNVLYSPLSPKSVPTPSFGISPLMTQSSADGGSKSQARSSGKRT
jgi:hypothetical protein